jgi:hypothetical protein
VKNPFFSKLNAYHIHVKFHDRHIVFSRKSRRKPEVDDEYIVFFEGKYRILRARKILKDKHLKVIAEVE